MTYIWNSTGRYQELFRDCHKKKKKSLLRVNERPIPTSSGPDIPGRLHPDTSLKLPTQRNIFPYWKDWGIQTLKMEKKEENVGNNRKKNKKIKISVFRCPLGEKKNAVSKTVTFSKRSLEKKDIYFLRCCVWQVWFEKVPVQWGSLCICHFHLQTQGGFLQASFDVSSPSGLDLGFVGSVFPGLCRGKGVGRSKRSKREQPEEVVMDSPIHLI